MNPISRRFFVIRPLVTMAATAVAALSVGCIGCERSAGPSDTPDATGSAAVSIHQMMFDPAIIFVKRGGTIEWTNNDVVAHTATAATFDSGSIESGKSWKRQFSEAGMFPYACTYHPDMTGTIVVK